MAVDNLLDVNEYAVALQAGVSLLEVYVELLVEGASLGQTDGRGDGDACAFGQFEQAVDDRLGGVLDDLLAGDGRVGMSDAGEEHAQVVVELGGCAHGGAGVVAAHFLLYGDGRGESLDIVALRLWDASEELSGVGRQALDVAAASLGVEGVEGKRRLAGAADAGDDREFASGDMQVDATQVVGAGALDFYMVRVIVVALGGHDGIGVMTGYSLRP